MIQNPQDPAKTTPFDKRAQELIDRPPEMPFDRAADLAIQHRGREALGFLQNLDAHGKNTINTALNATVDSATLLPKLASGAAEIIANPFSPIGESFESGWQNATNEIESRVGVKNPGWADFAMEAFTSGRFFPLKAAYDIVTGSRSDRSQQLLQQGAVSMRSKDEKYFEDRLLEDKIYSDVSGLVLSMAGNPGQAAGQTGILAAKALANAAKFTLGKSVRLGEMAAPAAAEAIKNGKAFEYLARIPHWAESTSRIERSLAAGGRGLKGLIEPTAANMAQSAAMSPDGERYQAMVGAAYITPFIVPWARVGQALGQKIADRSLTPAMREELVALQTELMSRGPSPTLVDKTKALLGQQAANAVASAFEGMALATGQVAIDEDTRKMFMAAVSGKDPDALGQLMRLGVASWGSSLMTKYAVPYDALPIWKRIRPDVERFQLEVETAAENRFFEQKAQDPKTVQSFVDLAKPFAKVGRALPESGWRIAQDRDPASPTFGKSFTVDEASKTLRGKLDYGPDHSIEFTSGTEEGVTLRLPKATADILNSTGEEPIQFLDAGDGMVTVAGGDATAEVLNRATLAGLHRRLQGEIQFSRAGFQDQGEHGWWDEASSTFYKVGLDGSLLSRKVGRDWSDTGSRIEVPAGPRIWEDVRLDAFNDLLRAKMVTSPDTITDQMLMQFSTLAGHEPSEAGTHARTMLAMLMGDGSDVARLSQALTNKRFGEALAGNLARSIADKADPMGAVSRILQQVDLANAKEVDLQGELLQRAVGEELQPQADPLQEARETQKASDVMRAEPAEQDVARAASETQAQKVMGPEWTLSDAIMGAMNEAPRADESGFIDIGKLGDMLFGKAAPEQIEAQKVRARADALRAIAEPGKPGLVGKLITPMVERLGDPKLSDPESRSRLLDPIREVNYEVRKTLSEINEDLTEAQTQARKDRTLTSKVAGPVEGTQMDAFGEAIEGRLRVSSEAGVEAVRRGKSFLKTLWGKAQEAQVRRPVEFTDAEGNTSVKWMPLSASEGGVIPRTPGPDRFPVMADPVQLRQLARIMAANADNKRAGYTAEKFFDEMSKHAKATTDQEVEAAFNYFRRLPWIPDWAKINGKWKHITDRTPSALVRIGNLQASSAATQKVFGPHGVPDEVRKQQGLKPGLQAAMEWYAKHGARSKEALDLAEILVEHMQGKNPRPGFRVMDGTVGEVESFLRASQTALQFRHDVFDPALATFPWFGLSRTLRGVAKTLASPVDTFAEARKSGVLLREHGEHAIREAQSTTNRIRDVLQWASKQSEKLKGMFMDRVARDMVADMQTGKFRQNADMADYLRALDYSDEQIVRMMAGEGSAKDYEQFRQRSHQFMSGQRRPSETSDLGASQKFNQIVRYQRFSLSRQHMLAKLARTVAGHVRNGEPIRAAVVMNRFMLGTAAASLGGQAFAYMLGGLFRGENGLKKWWSEIQEYPFQMLAKAAGQQLVGGALGTAAAATYEAIRDDPREALHTVAATTSVGSLATEAVQAAWDLTHGKGAYVTADGGLNPWVVGKRNGIIPAAAHWESLAGVIGLTDDKLGVSLKVFNEVANLAGVQRGSGGESKDAAFNISMKKIRSIMQQHVADPNNPKAMAQAVDQVLREAEPALRTALGLEEGKTIAASLRQARTLTLLDPAKRASMQRVISEEHLRNLYAYDRLIEQVADEYARMEGTKIEETSFEQRLSDVEKEVSTGGHASWTPLYEEVLDRATTNLINGSFGTEEIDKLAASMAARSETLYPVVSEQNWAVLRELDADSAGLFLTNMMFRSLEQRARGRIRDELIREIFGR